VGKRHRQKNRGAVAPLGVLTHPGDFVSEFSRPLAAPAPGRTIAPDVTLKVLAHSFSGPLPHPAILEHYERVSQGSSGRIIAQFEEQGRHRRTIETRVVWHNIASATLAQFMAFALLAGTIGAGVFLLYRDKRIEGLAAIITAIGGAAWVLKRAGVARAKNLDEKAEREKRSAAQQR
jgi:uncharacterized membrane protein